MFGHSTFAERPFGTAPEGTYDLTSKVFEFSVSQAVAQMYDLSIDRAIAIPVDTGWMPTTGVTQDSTGTSWTGLGNVLVSDNTYASVSLAGFASANKLLFSFAPGIPSGATITGVQVSTEGRVSAPPLLIDFIFLSNDGGINGISGSEILPAGLTASESVAFTPASPSMWGLNSSTLTPAILNGATFRLVFQLQANGATTVDLDQVRLRVLYTVPAKSLSFSFLEDATTSSLISRNRRVAASIPQQEANSFAAVRRARGIATSIFQGETYLIALNVQKAIKDMGSITIAQIETITQQIARARRVVLTQSEVEAIAATVERNRRLPFSIVETEFINGAVRRTRGVSMTITEAESVVQLLVRNRRVTASILEQIVYSIQGIGVPYTYMAFDLSQVETIVTNVARQRRVSFTQQEVEALAIVALARARRISTSVAEVETVTNAVSRNRRNTLTLTQTETFTASVTRLKRVALTLAETFGYQFDLAKIKLLSASIAEVEDFSFGSLRRTRRVAELINEVIEYAASVNRNRRTPFTIAQTEAIAEAIRRVRQVQAQLNESETITLAAGRRRAVQTTVNEIEQLTLSLVKVKLMAFVSNQTSGNQFFLGRARGAVVSVETLEDVQASFNRARALVSLNDQETAFTIDFNRIREQLVSITQVQGVDVAINRIRELLQSISNTFDVQFNVEVFKGDPSSLTVNVSWITWKAERTDDGAVLRQVINRQSLVVPIRVTATAQVIESKQATVVIDPDEQATLTVNESTERVVVIPNNTL